MHIGQCGLDLTTDHWSTNLSRKCSMWRNKDKHRFWGLPTSYLRVWLLLVCMLVLCFFCICFQLVFCSFLFMFVWWRSTWPRLGQARGQCQTNSRKRSFGRGACFLSFIIWCHYKDINRRYIFRWILNYILSFPMQWKGPRGDRVGRHGLPE